MSRKSLRVATGSTLFWWTWLEFLWGGWYARVAGDIQLRELHFNPPRSAGSPVIGTRTSASVMRRLRHGSAPLLNTGSALPARGSPVDSENGLARWSAPRYDGTCVTMHRKAGSNMTIRMRRLIVVVPVASILLLANFLVLGEWLDRTGVIGWARSINAEYITGTAIAVIAALLILIPSTPERERRRYAPSPRCPVCDEGLRPRGRYCPACGSRV